jgi:hypothetical protein
MCLPVLEKIDGVGHHVGGGRRVLNLVAELVAVPGCRDQDRALGPGVDAGLVEDGVGVRATQGQVDHLRPGIGRGDDRARHGAAVADAPRVQGRHGQDLHLGGDAGHPQRVQVGGHQAGDPGAVVVVDGRGRDVGQQVDLGQDPPGQVRVRGIHAGVDDRDVPLFGCHRLGVHRAEGPQAAGGGSHHTGSAVQLLDQLGGLGRGVGPQLRDDRRALAVVGQDGDLGGRRAQALVGLRDVGGLDRQVLEGRGGALTGACGDTLVSPRRGRTNQQADGDRGGHEPTDRRGHGAPRVQACSDRPSIARRGRPVVG